MTVFKAGFFENGKRFSNSFGKKNRLQIFAGKSWLKTKESLAIGGLSPQQEEFDSEDEINCSSDDDPKVVKACNQVLKKHKNDNKFDQDDWDSDLEEEFQHEQYIKKRIYHNEYYKKVLSEQIVCPACHKTFVKKNIRRHQRSVYHHKHGQQQE